LDEVRFDVRFVEKGRALELWEGEEKEGKGFDFPIERKPAQKPLSGVLKSNNCSNYYPVARPSLYLLFMQRALPERFEGRIGW